MLSGLTIGQHHVPFPVIQGGMGVRISGFRLAGHVALNGGIGIIAAAGLALNSDSYDGGNFFAADRQALLDELRSADWATRSLRAKVRKRAAPLYFAASASVTCGLAGKKIGQRRCVIFVTPTLLASMAL